MQGVEAEASSAKARVNDEDVAMKDNVSSSEQQLSDASGRVLADISDDLSLG